MEDKGYLVKSCLCRDKIQSPLPGKGEVRGRYLHKGNFMLCFQVKRGRVETFLLPSTQNNSYAKESIFGGDIF